jgi:hypothetical protein
MQKLGSTNRKTTNYKSANHKKDWVRKLQLRKVPHLQKVSKSNKLFKVMSHEIGSDHK